MTGTTLLLPLNTLIVWSGSASLLLHKTTVFTAKQGTALGEPCGEYGLKEITFLWIEGNTEPRLNFHRTCRM
jgi:hypothetical protein